MSTSSQPHVHFEVIQDIAVVGFDDDRIVSQEAVQTIGAQLYGLVDDRGFRKVLVNFRGVRIMTSAMLGKLMGLRKRLVAADGRLRLCGLEPPIREVFRIGQFDRVLEIDDDEMTALDRF
jgi:anti-anti-sigma factor